MKLHYWKIFVIYCFVEIVIAKDEKQRWNQKSQMKKFMETFLLKIDKDEESMAVANLLITIFNDYLTKCIPIILYNQENWLKNYDTLEILFKGINTSVIHGSFQEYNADIKAKFPNNRLETHCFSYIIFIDDLFNIKYIIGKQNMNKIVVVTQSSQWKVNKFLFSDESRSLINLLIISPSVETAFRGGELCYVLYTHELYVDGLGASAPKVLTSWRNGSLTRGEVKLFSQKMKNGFSGHRFITSVAHQPPFIIKRKENNEVVWDGIEIRLLQVLSQLYNFTIDIKPAKDDNLKSPADKVTGNVHEGVVNVGLAGIYLTMERLDKVDLSYPHSYDCAAFISLTSTALPRYRAIMGPFHWTVWLTVAIAYLFVIFPLSFADKLTLMHICKNPEEIENMFWYVFGTFTNSFTFGKETWIKSDKVTPRVLMGFYWIFTTIITACYTGSIIAFITIALYPTTIDTVKQLLSGRYQIGTLNKGGWEYWFKNSTDSASQKLLKNLELLPNIESGLINITRAIFWPYAFLGPKAQLDYIVQTNFTTNSKRSVLHISTECFVPFGVSIAFAKNSVYKDVIDKGTSYISQSGLINKFESDIRWDFMRSSTGKLLQANGPGNLRLRSIDDRSLNLEDTQGIFLLLGAGFLLGLLSLMFERAGGCFNCCKRRRIGTTSTLRSNPRIYDEPTLREQLDRLRLESIGQEDFIEENIELDIYQYNHSKSANLRRRNNEMQIGKRYSFDKVFGEETQIINNDVLPIYQE